MDVCSVTARGNKINAPQGCTWPACKQGTHPPHPRPFSSPPARPLATSCTSPILPHQLFLMLINTLQAELGANQLSKP